MHDGRRRSREALQLLDGLRPERADVVALTRAVDLGHARRLGLPVIRADVAGETSARLSYGGSAIVEAGGRVLHEGATLREDLLIAELDIG